MGREGRVSQHPLARYGAVLGISLLAGMMAGAVAGIVTATQPEGHLLGAAAIAAAVCVAMAVGLWASLKWWNGLDEAAQEAHKWAWWWGSTAGLAFAGVVLLTLLYGTGDLGQASAKSVLLVGAGIIMGFQTVGYGVAWAIWWLKRR